MDDANEAVAPYIGLPRLPVVEWPDAPADDDPRGLHRKTRHLVEWANRRPFIWVDDEISSMDGLWGAYRRFEPWGWKPVLYAHEVVLNELAQELRPAAEGVEWFEGLPEDEQRKVLHALVLFCGQARARQDDVPESIARSGVRPTHTPAVMLANWRFGMEQLPAYELTKSFRLLISLFSIADTRRRTLHCTKRCGHEWHNLPDPPRDANVG